ncbi:Otopetrin-like c [Carabus blaptoides fortunei]
MEDSSPDLSLKLRRGSSDSRDSFYMDFAQGIDSDIEEVATTSAADVGDTTGGDTTASPTTIFMPKDDVRR